MSNWEFFNTLSCLIWKIEVHSGGAYRCREVRTNLSQLSESGAQTITHCAHQFKQVRICVGPQSSFFIFRAAAARVTLSKSCCRSRAAGGDFFEVLSPLARGRGSGRDDFFKFCRCSCVAGWHFRSPVPVRLRREWLFWSPAAFARGGDFSKSAWWKIGENRILLPQQKKV